MTKRVRTPTMLQMEAAECGAACVAIILAYFGKWLPIEKVRWCAGRAATGPCSQRRPTPWPPLSHSPSGTLLVYWSSPCSYLLYIVLSTGTCRLQQTVLRRLISKLKTREHCTPYKVFIKPYISQPLTPRDAVSAWFTLAFMAAILFPTHKRRPARSPLGTSI